MLSIQNLSVLTGFATLLLCSASAHALPSVNLDEVGHPEPRDLVSSTSAQKVGPRGEVAGEGLAGAIEILFDAALAGINKEAAANLQKAFGVSTPTCCDGEIEACTINTGTDTEGNPWMACYFPGTATIYDFDVAAMKCIINLHYTQRDSCIDIKGSVCGNGYGGGLMRGQMGWWGKGHQKADQISAADSSTFQAAADSILNAKVSYDGGAQISFEVVDKSTGNLINEIMFDGHQGADC